MEQRCAVKAGRFIAYKLALALISVGSKLVRLLHKYSDCLGMNMLSKHVITEIALLGYPLISVYVVRVHCQNRSPGLQSYLEACDSQGS